MLKLVLEFTIPQLPVLDEERIVGLITTNTISRWLGARGASASLEESTADALQYSETRENYTILSKTESVAAVISAFSRRQKEGVPLEAILITEDGSPTRTLVGIVTATDLPEAHPCSGFLRPYSSRREAPAAIFLSPARYLRRTRNSTVKRGKVRLLLPYT